MKTSRQLLSHPGTTTQHETQSQHVEISGHELYIYKKSPPCLKDRGEEHKEGNYLIVIPSPVDADVYSQLHEFLLQGRTSSSAAASPPAVVPQGRLTPCGRRSDDARRCKTSRSVCFAFSQKTVLAGPGGGGSLATSSSFRGQIPSLFGCCDA